MIRCFNFIEFFLSMTIPYLVGILIILLAWWGEKITDKQRKAK